MMWIKHQFRWLAGYNHGGVINEIADYEACRQICEQFTDGVCKSFTYNFVDKTCAVSRVDYHGGLPLPENLGADYGEKCDGNTKEAKELGEFIYFVKSINFS